MKSEISFYIEATTLQIQNLCREMSQKVILVNIVSTKLSYSPHVFDTFSPS